jgi:hypothetical protein
MKFIIISAIISLAFANVIQEPKIVIVEMESHPEESFVPSRNGRVVGGNNAEDGKFKYAAFIRVKTADTTAT